MFNPNLKFLTRSLFREKPYVLINIAGLSLGVACFLIIGLYLHIELNYDRHNEDHEQIFRVVEAHENIGTSSVNTGRRLGETFVQDYPQILSSATFREYSFSRTETFFRTDDVAFYETEILYADSNVFDVFTFDILEGDPTTALINPGSIAVSASFAQRYFGDGSALNQVIRTDLADYTVRLVFGDLPQNTHLAYDALISLSSAPNRDDLFIRDNQHYNYLLTIEGFTPEDFEEISADFVDRYSDQLDGAANLRLFLEPLADIYLLSNTSMGGRPLGSIFALYAFSTTALFVLIIACINYINLATARSLRRIREVGVRKVLGANRGQLIAQYLGESFLITALAFVIGITVVEFVLSVTSLESLLGYQLSILTLLQPAFLVSAVASLLVVALASGLYPALYLGKILPVAGLKEKGISGEKGYMMRQVLILVQFIISIAIISSTFLMSSQMDFVLNQFMGFSRDNKIVIPVRGADAIENVVLAMDDLGSRPSITGVSLVGSGSYPGGRGLQGWPIGAVDEPGSTLFDRIYVDESFIDVMDIQLALGRDFDLSIVNDATEAVIVNESAVREMEWDEPLGKRLFLGSRNGAQATIIGVISDMHVRGLQSQIRPLAVSFDRIDVTSASSTTRMLTNRSLIIDMDSGSTGEILQYLESRWADIDPLHPFAFNFLDETLNRFYFTEERQMQLIGLFSGICIFISCLGLLGLSSYSTHRRAKEIGIRKILGATVSNIIMMFFKGTFYLMSAAAFVASIVSFIVVSRWLEGFYYRVEIDPLIFLQSTIIALFVAFVTTASQSWKIAQANPVEALRYE